MYVLNITLDIYVQKQFLNQIEKIYKERLYNVRYGIHNKSSYLPETDVKRKMAAVWIAVRLAQVFITHAPDTVLYIRLLF